ncbi:MAG: acyl-CoA dehydrogenase family protein [Burkholderiales bacterium]|nr:acyl-CoA dehydrogenase family protein [Burkholderiales bacterium]
MASEVKPAEDRVAHDANALLPEDHERLRRRARELGLWCVQSPAEHGGAGLNLLGQCVVAEEAAQCRMGLYFPAAGALGQDPPKVAFRGTPAQIRKYGAAAIASGATTCVSISEASGGSDPARAITTRAERRGDCYVVNGAKMWTSYIDQAEWGILYARTGAAGDRGGITAFFFDPRRRGISLTRIPLMRSHQPFEVRFDNYEIPVEDRLGDEGQGFAIAEEWLVHARVPYAAASIGVAQASLALAIDWAKQRKTFGALLADRQAIQWMLVDSEIELRAARLLVWQAAWKGDRGEDIKIDASIAKVYATEAAGRVVDRCMQILGGMGMTHALPLERWYRELRIRRVGEGPSEVQRMVIARDMLGGEARR